VRKLVVLGGLIVAGVATGQRGPTDWMTSGSDAQRSSWVRNDPKISPATIAQTGLKLVWKIKLHNESPQADNITSPALLDFYIGYRGFRTLAFFGGNDGVIGIDSELARTEWVNKYDAADQPREMPGCPGGMTSVLTRPTSTSYPPAPSGRGSGRGTPAKSGVGAPHEGSVVLSAVASRLKATPAPAASNVRAPRAPEPSPYAPHVQYVLALSSDGKLHSFWVSNGNEPSPGVDFIPANSHAVGLIAYDNAAYVATTGNCGAGNGVWSIDLKSRKVNHWNSSQAIAGTAGPAVTPDGTLFIGAGSDLIALAPRELETIAVHKSGGAEFSSSPVAFEFNGKNLIAIARKDGRLDLFQANSSTGLTPLESSASFSGSAYASGSLASWRDLAGTRWVLASVSGSFSAPTEFRTQVGQIKNGAIVAWKVVDKNGTPALEPGWISGDLAAPLPPIVVNGVVFVVANGESQKGEVPMPAGKSASAILYAVDGISGKDLWNSGNVMESFAQAGSLAAGGGRVYVSTHDGTQYAFGFPIEH
jgi:outer membrane protein assembly factor BamB